jgi:hypothetical protein
MGVALEAPAGYETAVKNALQTLMRPPIGCKAYVGTDLTAQNISAAFTPIALNTQTYRDVTAIHDTASNNTRFTIPTGYTWAEFNGQLSIALITANLYIYASVQRYNSSDVFQEHMARQSTYQGHTEAVVNVSTGRIPVVAGEIYKLAGLVLTDTSVTIKATETWLSVKLWP